ncbi:acyl-CoA dehydrogenase [Prauserella marina]|uniref:Acyl-CoA dehydrogenase n=1 Tax=Prauserella marina TaxID=530584 RepID=A0A222VUX1_9PSEU|nr:acyl-CoA dehydrogenase family protein [Prauserella marina]ASR37705.1 acyl-CoA dehydrogenase [Prauserella marina]PWV75635.1 alkylation response protein AidB-like acyl-CoA dehydrogenase [Prauserella marina]SDD30024.1 Acyl-CoA dehydrogenase [Prauserella marina]
MALDIEARRDFAAAVAEFAQRECGTREKRVALNGGETEAHSPELYAKLADLGWTGVAMPAEYGGGGGGLVEACLLLEELAYGQVPVFALGISMIAAKAVEKFGTPEQKEHLIGSFCRGEISSVAMSEPEAGSDVGALRCKAKRDGDNFILNGQKTWISCAHYADRILLVCRTDSSGPKHAGITMLTVPLPSEGVSIHGIETMAGREVNDVYFTDTVVPAGNVIGAVGGAWRQLMAGLNFERLTCAAIFLGKARRAFDDTLHYVSGRTQFGTPVGSFQALRHRIADLATELECSRAFVYDIAEKVDADPGTQRAREASMAKLKVTETAKRISIEGMQMFGGAGYTKEYDIERHLRGNIISTVFAGTSEVQREIIAGSYGL